MLFKLKEGLHCWVLKILLIEGFMRESFFHLAALIMSVAQHDLARHSSLGLPTEQSNGILGHV